MKSSIILFILSLLHFSLFSQTAVVTALAPTVLCAGDTLILTSSNSDPGNSVIQNSVWTVSGPNGFIYSSTTFPNENFQAVLSDIGFYSLALTNIHQDQSTSQTQVVNFIEVKKPVADFSYILLDVAMGQSPFSCPPIRADFTDHSLPSGEIESWHWILENDPFNPQAITSTNQHPQNIWYTYAQNYDATLIVKDSIGCSDTMSSIDFCVIYGPFALCSLYQTGNFNFMEYQFNIMNALDIETITWDLGNGQVIENDFDGFTFTYPISGIFHPVVYITDVFGCQSPIFLGEISPGTNSLESISGNHSISLYPNPTTGIFEIKNATNLDAVSILDVSGKVVKEFTNLSAFDGGKIQVDVSELPDGFYQVLIFSKEKSVPMKLIKN